MLFVNTWELKLLSLLMLTMCYLASFTSHYRGCFPTFKVNGAKFSKPCEDTVTKRKNRHVQSRGNISCPICKPSLRDAHFPSCKHCFGLIKTRTHAQAGQDLGRGQSGGGQWVWPLLILCHQLGFKQKQQVRWIKAWNEERCDFSGK